MERSKEFKESKAKKIVFAIVFILFAFYALTYIYVMIWAITVSLKTQVEFTTKPLGIPKSWKIINYIDAFKEVSIDGLNGSTNLFGMFFNSIWISLGTTIISLFFTSLTAYIVAKYKFKFRNAIYTLAIAVMIIPIVGALPAYYRLVSELGIINSPLMLLAATGGLGFNFIIFHGFFSGISNAYAEAAKIDGASHLKIFLQIMAPQAKGSYIALGILAFIGQWNDYSGPLLYYQSYPTIASGLFLFEQKMLYGSNYPVYFAGIIMSMVPVIILYASFQKTIMNNSIAGGLKG